MPTTIISCSMPTKTKLCASLVTPSASRLVIGRSFLGHNLFRLHRLLRIRLVLSAGHEKHPCVRLPTPPVVVALTAFFAHLLLQRSLRILFAPNVALPLLLYMEAMQPTTCRHPYVAPGLLGSLGGPLDPERCRVARATPRVVSALGFILARSLAFVWYAPPQSLRVELLLR